MTEPLYVRAASVDDAIAALSSAGTDGLVIAGGVVVASLFNQRLASPSVLVDISRIPSLHRLERLTNGDLIIADQGNDAVRMVNRAGVITLVAGTP